MWVYEEMVDGRKLTEIINEKHENVKYVLIQAMPALPGSCVCIVLTLAVAQRQVPAWCHHPTQRRRQSRPRQRRDWCNPPHLRAASPSALNVPTGASFVDTGLPRLTQCACATSS